MFRGGHVSAISVILSLCAGLYVGCGGKTTPVPEAPPNYTELALPSVADLADRQVRAMNEETQYPGDQLAASDGVSIGGGNMYITAPAGGLAWAIWGWRELDYGYHYPVGATIVQGTAKGCYWLGVPDFAYNRWRFAGPYSGLELHVFLDQISPLRASARGVSYLAIICSDGATAQIQSLTLELDWYSHQPGVLPVMWTTASTYDSDYELLYVHWPCFQPRSGFYLLKWRAGTDPAKAELITHYPPDDPNYPNAPIGVGYCDSAVELDTYYQYRAIPLDSFGLPGPPGPIALGYCGEGAGHHDVRGRIMYDDWFGIPGCELYIPELELHTSTDWRGEYLFPKLPPGAYNLWLVTPAQPRFIKLVQVQNAAVAVPDFQFSPQSVPDWNWYWLYPPAEVTAVEVADNVVQLSWSTAEFANEYVAYRTNRLDPEGLVELYRGTDLSLTLPSEPAGELEYYVQSVDYGVDYYWEYSPYSAPAALRIPYRGLGPDTLYAVPEQLTAHDGERVRVTVYSNLAANPLAYMNCCRITYENTSCIDLFSVNVGAPGGDRSAPDGLWAAVDPADGILEVPQYMLEEFPLANGRTAFDFNVTPLEGLQLENATGALFNFEIEVHGDVNFSFMQESEGMHATYYSGYSSEEHCWNDIYNYGQPGITLVEE